MDQATHVAIFGGSELLLVQLDRTYYLDRISSWCDRAGYFTKRLAYHLLFCGGLQLHALGGSNRVGPTPSLIRQGSSNKSETLAVQSAHAPAIDTACYSRKGTDGESVLCFVLGDADGFILLDDRRLCL